MKTMVVGVGNEYRGDDGAGRQVARALTAPPLPGIEVRESSGESLSLMELWAGADRVLLVDAVQTGAEPGTLHRFDAGDTPLPAEFLQQCSTHALSLAEAVEMARALDSLPREVVVYGIEALSFEHGTTLTPTVREAVERTVAAIRRELSTEPPTQATNPAEDHA